MKKLTKVLTLLTTTLMVLSAVSCNNPSGKSDPEPAVKAEEESKIVELCGAKDFELTSEEEITSWAAGGAYATDDGLILNYDKVYSADDYESLTLEYEKNEHYKGMWLFINSGDDIDSAEKIGWTSFPDYKNYTGDWEYSGKITVSLADYAGKKFSAVGVREFFDTANTTDTVKVTKCYLTKK